MFCTYSLLFLFFFNDTATTEIYTLSYTTLFRSMLAGRPASEAPGAYSPRRCKASRAARSLSAGARSIRARSARSEEHTSELQSLAYLVCRLLLEKKKTNTRTSELRPLVYAALLP